MKFQGDYVIMTVTSDEWDACKKAGYDMGYYNQQCQPGDKQGNGIIEGRLGSWLVGVRERIDQAGVPSSFWVGVCQFVAFIVNSEASKTSGISPYNARFGEGFLGYYIPWGSFVWFLPQKYKAAKADTVLQPGIFAGTETRTDNSCVTSCQINCFREWCGMALGWPPHFVYVRNGQNMVCSVACKWRMLIVCAA